MDVLYLSYDGMTDALGRSQVIPYLRGLSEKGHRIHVISCEKRETYEKDCHQVNEIFSKTGIGWTPLKFSSFPPLLSKIFDLYKIRRAAIRQHRRTPFESVHCRSYIVSFVGLYMKQKLGLKFVFDMRGFWVDERFEGNIWNPSCFFYKKAYKYFKRKEREFFIHADAVISLTESGRRIIGQTFGESVANSTSVIPCCVDVDLFSQQYISAERKDALRKQLRIEPAHFVLSYLGSIGTWYMIAEMMAFFRRLLRIYSDARFLFITGEDPEVIIREANKAYVDPLNLVIVKAGRREVPEYLSLSDASIFFIKPVFSKKASSPTKQAEVMSMGIPFISNKGIGDTDAIVERTGVGILIDEFSDRAYDEAIARISGLLAKSQDDIRACAINHFNLENGIERYDNIYRNLS